MRFGAVLIAAIAALAAAPSSAQPSRSPILLAIEDVCLPVLRHQVATTEPEAFAAFVAGKGFLSSISNEQIALFPPPADRALSRALLVSGKVNEQSFVMAIGGSDNSCRLFVIGGSVGLVASNALGDEFARGGVWHKVDAPDTASPRIAMVQGLAEQPTALTLIFWTNELPGISHHVVAFAY
jgi:hypothetical protein